MADSTINGLTALTGANVDHAADQLAIWDNSDSTTKKINVTQIASAIYSANPSITTGTFADPNGNVAAVPGSIYFDLTTPASPVEWVKTTGTGNTGWI